MTDIGIVCACELEKLYVLSHRVAPKNAELEMGVLYLHAALYVCMHAPAPARGTCMRPCLVQVCMHACACACACAHACVSMCVVFIHACVRCTHTQEITWGRSAKATLGITNAKPPTVAIVFRIAERLSVPIASSRRMVHAVAPCLLANPPASRARCSLPALPVLCVRAGGRGMWWGRVRSCLCTIRLLARARTSALLRSDLCVFLSSLPRSLPWIVKHALRVSHACPPEGRDSAESIHEEREALQIHRSPST